MTILKEAVPKCPSCRDVVHPGDLCRNRSMDDIMGRVVVRCQLLPAGGLSESRLQKRPRISSASSSSGNNNNGASSRTNTSSASSSGNNNNGASSRTNTSAAPSDNNGASSRTNTSAAPFSHNGAARRNNSASSRNDAPEDNANIEKPIAITCMRVEDLRTELCLTDEDASTTKQILQKCVNAKRRGDDWEHLLDVLGAGRANSPEGDDTNLFAEFATAASCSCGDSGTAGLRNDGRCDWTGEFKALQHHLDNHCPTTTLSCTYMACREHPLRKDAVAHEIACGDRVLNCVYCYSDYTCRVLGAHEEVCHRKRIFCTNDECDKFIARGYMASHKLSCPFEIIPCPCAPCDTTCRRRDMAAHVNARHPTQHFDARTLNDEQAREIATMHSEQLLNRHTVGRFFKVFNLHVPTGFDLQHTESVVHDFRSCGWQASLVIRGSEHGNHPDHLFIGIGITTPDILDLDSNPGDIVPPRLDKFLLVVSLVARDDVTKEDVATFGSMRIPHQHDFSAIPYFGHYFIPTDLQKQRCVRADGSIRVRAELTIYPLGVVLI
jgi:TRAF-type zinc finger